MEEHVPVVLGNYAPFRLVLREGQDSWTPSLEEVNARTYDYVKLHRASLFIDVGIAPLSLAICVDGTLALPAVERFRDPDQALFVFNRTLCEALMGEVYCEAMSPDDLCLGMMTLTAYCKSTGGSRGPIAAFHRAIRTKHVGTLDAIRLLTPETVGASELQRAVGLGRRRLKEIGHAAPETLLHGATFFARNQWTEALIHLWTTIEQITESLWSESVVGESSVRGIPRRRRKDFLSDHRTWSAAAKLEVLHQKNLLPEDSYALLDRARLARNQFVHSGTPPSRRDAEAALDGVCQIAALRLQSEGDEGQVQDVAELVKARSRTYSDWERRAEPIEGVTHWMAIPPLPGDESWGDREYEVIEELQLKPLGKDGS